jgi:hypothetical protein
MEQPEELTRFSPAELTVAAEAVADEDSVVAESATTDSSL